MIPELRQIVAGAYKCPAFAGACRDHCRWSPSEGHVPRGYGGAIGRKEDVDLIVITAEPGDPGDRESYATTPPPSLPEAIAAVFERSLEFDSLRRAGRAAPYHRNLKELLSYFYPGAETHTILRRTWFTNAVLCSAPVSGGRVASAVENECGQRYLQKQLQILPQAFVLALGGKAKVRLQRLGLENRLDFVAHHPSARNPTEARKTWQAAATAFHEFLDRSA